MRHRCAVGVVVFSMGAALLMNGQDDSPALTLTDVTVGQNLQTSTTVNLIRGPVSQDLDITITSSDPAKMVLSTAADAAGKPSIALKLSKGSRELTFYVQALAKTGVVTFTAAAQGVTGGSAKVTLAPSGLVLAGPYGTGKVSFITTTGVPRQLTIHSALLDSSMNYLGPQAVAGGRTVSVSLTSSNAAVGKIAATAVQIAPGTNRAATQFQPSGVGETKLALVKPSGLELAADQFASIQARVLAPALNLPQVVVGQQLVTGAAVTLGEVAPAGGLLVTVKSDNPDKALLSVKEDEPGSATLQLKIPAGGSNALFMVQGGPAPGTASYTASAPGYGIKTSPVIVAPTGVIITGPASITRSGLALGFVAPLSAKEKLIPITIYSAYLDPATLRAGDLTVQHVKFGASITAELSSSDTAIGTVGSPLTIKANTDNAETRFTPLAIGRTTVSVATPKGFSTPSNATSIRALITK